jgi:hypothetical protein
MSDVVVSGSVVGMPDVWRNRFPVSRTFIELLTTYSSTPLGIAWTDPEGRFSVVSTNHSPDIPYESLYLVFSHNSTGERYVPDPRFTFGGMTPVLGFTDEHFELGKIKVPWVAKPRVIAGWDGREFTYPWDFVRSLITSTRGLIMGMGLRGSLQLVRALPHAAFLQAMEHNDLLFSVLERESKRTNKAKVSFDPISGKARQPLTEMLANAIVPALGLNPMKVRNSKDAFLKALEYFSDIRFNNALLPSFNSSGLESAVRMVFGGRSPLFYGFDGRASFCGLVFAAAALDAGLEINVTFATVGAAHVTIINIS